MIKASEKINNIINNLYKEYCARYGAVIFGVEAVDVEDGAEIKGKVLVENQRNEILDKIKKSGIKIIKEEIKVVSDPREKLEIGWGEVDDRVIDVLGRYIFKESMTSRAINKFRATQLAKRDIVRILSEKDGQFLVQAEDLTLGWAEKLKIKKAEMPPEKYRKKWEKILRVGQNKAIKAKKPEKAEIGKFIKKFLGVPYVLGGTTENGIDCSALTQRMFKEFYGVLLPRHSGDQAKCGIEIKNIKEIKAMDLVFLKLKKNSHFHIGAVIDALNYELRAADLRTVPVFNARLDNGGVVVQNLEEILKDYELLGIRRIIV